MDVKIFTFVFCPLGESPTKENCNTFNVVASSMESAFSYAAVKYPDKNIVSFSYSADAIMPGTIVDFE